ncbi:MAG TPA: GNAT family N-acetyltransferase [Micromonosporaceae bacterium]
MMAENTITIRDAELTDAEAMGRVHGEAWRVGYATVFEAGFLSFAVEQRRTGWGQLLSERRVRESRVLVAEVGGVMRGLTRFGRADRDAATWELFALYVDPSYWGTGVAPALMNRVTDEFRRSGAPRATLWTLAEARRARRFYEKSGWHLTPARRERDFGDGIPRPLVQYHLFSFSADEVVRLGIAQRECASRGR